jgi:hypothetical protein
LKPYCSVEASSALEMSFCRCIFVDRAPCNFGAGGSVGLVVILDFEDEKSLSPPGMEHRFP